MKAKYGMGVAPEEAIEYFLAKEVVPSEVYKSMEALYRDAAFSISGVEEDLLLQAAKAGLDHALETGATGAEFESIMNAAFDAAGVGPLGKHHMETVFRTNIMSAYSAGRYEQQMDPDVMEEYPWFEFRTISGNPCDICDPMNGFQAPKDDPVWDKYYPPLHHNCMCEVISIRAPEDQRTKRPPVEPAEGFDVRPGAYHREV